jgi:hypothetical protein
MKKSLFAIGILLLVGLALVPRLSALGSQPGLTSYVRRVLERVQKMEDSVDDKQQSGEDKYLIPGLMKEGRSTVYGTRNVNVMYNLEREKLVRLTPCLRADIALIQKKMEDVRSKLHQAEVDKKALATSQLAAVYSFLADRLDALESGALNPSYQDISWQKALDFEGDAFKEEEMCPFSTKYFDMSVDGSYGCTPDVMSEAGNSADGTLKTAIDDERKALQDLLDKLHSDLSSDSAAYQVLQGCQDKWPANFRTWSHGRFIPSPGQRFMTLLTTVQSLERLRPSPFDVENLFGGAGTGVLNAPLALDLLTFSTKQRGSDATIITGAMETRAMEDAFLPLTSTVGKLTKIVHGLNQKPRSLRDFLLDFAYFLRRSCMNRSCDGRLDRIMKITRTDACFPFTEGLDEESVTDETKFKKWVEDTTKECKKAAEVDRL